MVTRERARPSSPKIRTPISSFLQQSWTLAAATLLLLGSIGAVQAHAHLKSASPPVDGVVATSPGEVTVTFTERLEVKLSRLEVKDSSGRAVSKDDVHFPTDGDGRTLAVSVPTLPAGSYTVQWTAASVDTHKTTGAFSFVVKP